MYSSYYGAAVPVPYGIHPTLYNAALVQWNMQQQQLAAHAYQQSLAFQIPRRVEATAHDPEIRESTDGDTSSSNTLEIEIPESKDDDPAQLCTSNHDIQPRPLVAEMCHIINIVPTIDVDQLGKELLDQKMERDRLNKELADQKNRATESDQLHKKLMSDIEQLRKKLADQEKLTRDIDQLRKTLADQENLTSDIEQLRKELIDQENHAVKLTQMHRQSNRENEETIKHLKKNQKENFKTVRSLNAQVEKLEATLKLIRESEAKYKEQFEKAASELKVLDDNSHMLVGFQAAHDKNFAEVRILGDSALDPEEKNQLVECSVEDLRIKLLNYMVYRPIGLKYIRDLQNLYEAELQDSRDAIQRLVDHIQSVGQPETKEFSGCEEFSSTGEPIPESPTLDKKDEQIQILQSVIRTLRMDIERRTRDVDVMKQFNTMLIKQVDHRKNALFDFIHRYIKTLYWQQAQLFVILMKYFNHQHKSCDEEFERIFKHSKSEMWSKFQSDMENETALKNTM